MVTIAFLPSWKTEENLNRRSQCGGANCAAECGLERLKNGFPFRPFFRERTEEPGQIIRDCGGKLRARFAPQGSSEPKRVISVLGDDFGVNPLPLSLAPGQVKPSTGFERNERCGRGKRKPVTNGLVGLDQGIIILIDENRRQAMLVGPAKYGSDYCQRLDLQTSRLLIQTAFVFIQIPQLSQLRP